MGIVVYINVAKHIVKLKHKLPSTLHFINHTIFDLNHIKHQHHPDRYQHNASIELALG